jgi:hypothetical protein
MLRPPYPRVELVAQVFEVSMSSHQGASEARFGYLEPTRL